MASTLLASLRKSARLVPISDRQKTAMSTVSSARGTCRNNGREHIIYTYKWSHKLKQMGYSLSLFYSKSQWKQELEYISHKVLIMACFIVYYCVFTFETFLPAIGRSILPSLWNWRKWIKMNSLLPCHTLSPGRRWEPDQSCGPCFSHCVQFYSRHSQSLQLPRRPACQQRSMHVNVVKQKNYVLTTSVAINVTSTVQCSSTRFALQYITFRRHIYPKSLSWTTS